MACDGLSSSARTSIELSIIAPAHNEEGNLERLAGEVRGAMAGSGISFELIVIDDGSTDGTGRLLARLVAMYPWFHAYRMLGTPRGRGHGQSAAFAAGIARARGELIAMIDADCQNDPADLPDMVRLLHEHGADMVQGDRTRSRADGGVRRFSSWVGRTFRRCALGDTIQDTGCSLRILRRELAMALPLQFRHMHRFIPYYARLLGRTVIEVPVNHRLRTAGVAKYGMWNRALPGLHDLVAVRWMRRRLRPVKCEPVERDACAAKSLQAAEEPR